MVWNLTAISKNSTSYVSFFQEVNNTLMLGWFGTLFLIGFFLITLMAFYFTTKDTAKSLSAASFIIFILAIFLRAISMIDSLTLYITLIISAVTIAFTWKK